MYTYMYMIYIYVYIYIYIYIWGMQGFSGEQGNMLYRAYFTTSKLGLQMGESTEI